MFKTLEAGGKIVVTGVGKSGKIGEKIVATLLSTGTCAAFLHPVEAVHGDLGVLQPKDAVLALSFSGNTEELTALIPSLRQRNIPIIGLCGKQDSKLVKECAAWIDGYVSSEAGEPIPAPTSSTTLALALGDAIALTLAKLRGFTPDGFALNHPGGSLGRKLLLKVSDVYVDSEYVAYVTPDMTLDRVIMEMTRCPQGSGVVVLEEEVLSDLNTGYPSPPLSTASSVSEEGQASNIMGIITYNDIHKLLKTKKSREGIFELCAADIMKPNPIVFRDDALASEAYKFMIENQLTLLPTVNKFNSWTGLLLVKDLQALF
ncbi:hypothetical protein BY458DRAFT_432400 [Sporodiniella umbellata]|nr:hypothetical protein BY458DRAFT_432400 [Sporodiniella umbellata]